jgi:hypothetical protein
MHYDFTPPELAWTPQLPPLSNDPVCFMLSGRFMFRSASPLINNFHFTSSEITVSSFTQWTANRSCR